MRNIISIAIVTTIYKPDYFYLQKTLTSVYKQNVKNITHYLLFDGKNDDNNISRLIEDYKMKMNSIKSKVIVNTLIDNVGVDKAHFYIFDKINESYFTWLDCGDYYNKNYLKHIIRVLKYRKDVDVIHSDYQGFNDSKLLDSSKSFQYKKYVLRSHDQFVYFCTNNFFYGSFFVKKEVYTKFSNSCYKIDNRITNSSLFYDAQLILFAVLDKRKFKYIDKVGLFVYESPHSVSRALHKECLSLSKEEAIKKFVVNCNGTAISSRDFVKYYSFINSDKILLPLICFFSRKYEEMNKEIENQFAYLKSINMPLSYHPYYKRYKTLQFIVFLHIEQLFILFSHWYRDNKQKYEKENYNIY